MRTDVSGDPTFTELLSRVRATALGAYAHQDLPFEKLVEGLEIERDLSHSPMVQVMFVLQNTPAPDLRMDGLQDSILFAPTNDVSVDLTLEATESGDGIDLAALFNADLFDDLSMQRL